MSRLRPRRPAAHAIGLRPALLLRIALGAFGLWVLSIGARGLLRGHPFAANAPVGRWLLGGVVAHDAIIAPTVFALGAAASRVLSVRMRQALAAVLLIGGSVLIVGLPDVLRKGHNANPTVTPLDYSRNLVIVLLAIGGGVFLVTAADAVRHRAGRRPSAQPVPPVEPDEPGTHEEPAPTLAASESGNARPLDVDVPSSPDAPAIGSAE